MPDLAIAPLALDDLKTIGRYSQTKWGVAQRNAYLGDFAKLFEQLRSGAIAGRARNEIKVNLLSYPCNKHLVFFRRDNVGTVETLRILHGRMDFARHL